jgi:hypothetical protein
VKTKLEDLRKWFGKGKKGDWVRVGTDGEIKGDCARDPGEGKPKCMPRSKAHSMDKKDRASSARRKRRADPSVDRPGTGNKPIMVKTDKKESVEMNEATAKIKTTMADKVASSATRFGLKAKSQGGHVTISGAKGKLNDFMRSIIGRSSYGNASDVTESVEMNEEVYISREYEGGQDYKMDQKRIMTAIRKAGGKGKVEDTPTRRDGGMLSISATGTTGDKIRKALGRDDGLTDIDEDMNEEFVVKYAKNKRGPIYQTKFKTQPEAEKFLAQKRKEGMNGIVSKGGKPVSMQRMKDMQKESVELDEAADFMKMSKELLKHKSKGIEYEKAAAYVRIIHNNSAVSVQDKAFMALTKMLKDMDDFTKKTTITKILKDNGFKVRGGKLMREELDEATMADRTVLRAVRIAKDMGGNMTGAVKRIEKMKKGLSDHPKVQAALRLANESLEEKNVPTNPSLWAKFKAQAKAKFDVYPSAYANGWAAKKYKAAGGSWKTESVQETKSFWDVRDINEDYRKLARKGMGTETKNSINVGREIDYYDGAGSKRMGKVVKMGPKSYMVKDEKDGRVTQFFYHDRAKAKELLAKK